MVIQFMRAYQIENEETLRKWTTDLITDDHLMTLNDRSDLIAFLKAVHDICSDKKEHDMKHALFEILLNKFKQSKRGGIDMKQRHNILHIIHALVTKDSMSHELLQVVLEHFFSAKELSDVEDIGKIVNHLVKLALPQDVMDLLVTLIKS